MTSNNLVKQALGWIVVLHLYMISCNPVKGSWQGIVFHSYMTFNNPVKGSWLNVVSSFFKYYKKNITPLKKT